MPFPMTTKKPFAITKLALAISSGLLTLTATGAFAAGQIEEVTVTAEKREASLQTTPIAISTMNSESLKNMGVTSFEGVARASPSISFTPYPSSSNVLILYMRAQGVSDANQITSDGSVGLYEDGFYISRPQSSTFDIADIERVEVLRGPQGTLYGRNTTGGAVNLISKKPTGEFDFKQDFTFGTRDYFRSLTAVNLPKWNDISTKLTILKSSIDGYVKNPGSGHDYGEQAQLGGRFALHWDGIENFTVDYFLEKGNLDSTPSYYQNAALSGSTICSPVNSLSCTPHAYGNGADPASRAYRPTEMPLSTSNFEAHGLTLTWDPTQNLTIKSLTSYRRLYWHAFQDYMESFSTSAAFPVSTFSEDAVSSHQFTQEFQFIGNLLDDSIKYVGGLYYFKESASHDEPYTIQLPDFAQTFGVPPETIKNRFANADAKSRAIYAQLTWTPPILDNRLDITAGARYTKDDRSVTRHSVIDTDLFGRVLDIRERGNQSFNRFNPALTINYSWTDDISTYAKATTGYKAGGFSESAPPGNMSKGFSPEKVTTLEAGLKSYWFDRRVRFNAAVFQSKFDDMQLQFTMDPNDFSIIQAFNAGKATVKGFEGELLVMPIDDLSLSLDYAYLHAEFDTVEALAGTVFDPAPTANPSSPYVVGQNIKEVFRMPYAPRHTVNLGMDYTFLHFASGTMSAHLDYHFQEHMFDSAPTGKAVPGADNYSIPSYGIINGRVTMALDLPRGDKAKISLWGKNLANHEYKLQTIGLGSGVDTASAPAGYNGQAAIWAEPPSYGIDISYQY